MDQVSTKHIILNYLLRSMQVERFKRAGIPAVAVNGDTWSEYLSKVVHRPSVKDYLLITTRT